jgi:hypothetical protein
MSESAQPAPETDEKKSRGFGSYVVWPFAAVMAYVLSFGPVAKIEFSMRRTHPAFVNAVNVIYSPWAWVYRKTAFHKPLEIYIHLWIPGDVDQNGRIPAR